jgi:outer membrane protein assembly factor BamB
VKIMDGPTVIRTRSRLTVLAVVATVVSACGSAAVASAPTSGAPAVPATSQATVTAQPLKPRSTSTTTVTPVASGGATLAGLPSRDRAAVAIIDTQIHEKKDLPGFFNQIAVAGGDIWLGSPAGLVRVDPADSSSKIIDTDAGAWVSGQGDALWRAAFYFDTLKRYDATTGRVTRTIDVAGPAGVLPLKSTIWLAQHNEGTVIGLDPKTGQTRVTQKVTDAGNAGPGEIVLADGALWIVVPRDGTVVKVDKDKGTVLARVDLGFHVGERLSFAGGALWANAIQWEGEAPPPQGTMIRLDPRSLAVTTVTVPAHHGLVADIEGEPWLPVGDALVLLDRTTGQPLRVVRFGIAGYDAWVVRDALAGVWVASQSDPRLVRLSAADLRPIVGK